MAETIKLTADVEIQAASADGESKGPPKFSILAYNGGALEVSKYDTPVIVDLKGLTYAKSVVANMHHDGKQIVGHVTEITKDGGRLLMAGAVSGAGAAANEVLQSAANGFPWQASIEARPTRIVEVPEGKQVEVNGQVFAGPVSVARKAKLFGVAFVPRGADENTSVSIAASAAGSNPTGDKMKFHEWIEAMGFDVESLTDKQKAALQSKYDAEIKASSKTDDDGEQVIEAAPAFDLDDVKSAAAEYFAELEAKAAEHESEIRDQKKFAEVKAAAIKSARDLKAKAIREKWPATRLEVEAIKAGAKFELELVRLEAPRGPSLHVSRRDESPAVIEAALCLAASLPNPEKAFPEETLEAADKQYRNMGLQQFLIMAAASNGYVTGPGERIHNGNLRQILAHALPPTIMASNGFSTLGVSTSNILSNVATKELVAGYMEQDQTWRQVSAVKSVRDFKAMTTYRLLDDMSYEQVGPTGEIKHGAVGQENYTRQAKTYAKMFSLTRTDIINDDLGAFDDLRTRLGAGAAMKLNDIFWTAFLDNASFFTSGRGNYITGATTTLLTDGVGLGLAVKAFRQMTSSSTDGSKRIGGSPSLLLVPPELETAADSLYQSRNLVGGSTTVTDANTHAGKYRPVVCPWLSDSNFSGFSTTAWYLLRDPSIYPSMVVSFLNGQQSPTVESADADFGTLGIEFRGYHDFGCDKAEYVAGVKSKGAA